MVIPASTDSLMRGRELIAGTGLDANGVEDIKPGALLRGLPRPVLEAFRINTGSAPRRASTAGMFVAKRSR
jgi:hypothetical protein